MPDGRSKTSALNGLLGGRPKLEATKFREILIEKIEKEAEPLAQALITKGLGGDVPALKEILDRGLGKVVQGLDHTTLGKEMPAPILGGITQKKDGDGTSKKVES